MPFSFGDTYGKEKDKMKNFNKDHVLEAYVNLKAEDGEKVSLERAKSDVDTALYAMMEVLSRGKDAEPNNKNVRSRLRLVGFGTLEIRHREGRAYNNPQGGAKIHKDSENVVAISAGSNFSEMVQKD